MERGTVLRWRLLVSPAISEIHLPELFSHMRRIPDSFVCDRSLLEWLDETGKRVFDDDLVMDYGSDCLRL